MEFEWDPAKSQWTLENRGFDFFRAARVFADPLRLDRIDTRRAYGEERRQTVGRVETSIYFVAYTIRGDNVRIISARIAHENEREDYWSESSQSTPD